MRLVSQQISESANQPAGLDFNDLYFCAILIPCLCVRFFLVECLGFVGLFYLVFCSYFFARFSIVCKGMGWYKI
jgi:hypothetical protein